MAGERVHVLSSALYSTTLDTCIYWYLLKMQPCKFYKILVTSNLSCLCNQEMKLDDDAMNVEKYVGGGFFGREYKRNINGFVCALKINCNNEILPSCPDTIAPFVIWRCPRY